MVKHGLVLTFLIFNLFSQSIAFAGHKYPRCSDALPKGTICRNAVKELRPTQPDVGKKIVKQKREQFEKIGKNSAKELEKLKIEKVVPVIVGPDGKLYLVDHHHTSLALWEAGEKDVYVKVLENWSDMAPGHRMPFRMKTFWNKMKANQYCYLFTEDGTLIDPMSIVFPRTLKECGNNRYRALASLLIQKNLVTKTRVNYFEFYIAEELRKLGVVIPSGRLKAAIKLAKKDLATPEGQAAIARAAIPKTDHCFLNELQSVVAAP